MCCPGSPEKKVPQERAVLAMFSTAESWCGLGTRALLVGFGDVSELSGMLN